MASAFTELNLAPDAATLRRFGFVALGGFALLAACARFEVLLFAGGLGAARDTVALTCVAAGVLAALCSLVCPAANRPLWVVLVLAGFPIGYVVSHLVLAVLFFGVFAPLGALLRALGKDPLERARSQEATTYWTPAGTPDPKERYFRQF